MTAWLFGTKLGEAGTLQYQGEASWVVIGAIFLGLSLILAAPGKRSMGARFAELALLLVAGGVCLWALAGPVWVEESGRTVPGRTVILVDGSRSMGIMEAGAPRSDAADARVAELRAQLPDAEVYHFGDDLALGAPGAYDLPGTDVEAALSALRERLLGERASAVVLVTDGLDRGLMRKTLRESPELADASVPGPLTVVQVGTVGELVDLAVRSVDAGGFAFVRSPFQVRATLSGDGMAGRQVSATLTRDGSVLTKRQVTLDAEGKGEVEFEVTPDKAGRFTYAVSVPVVEGDAVPENNTMPLVVKVVRDKMRVLQVAGSPSWDVKFLRRFLKGDPSVDLVSFFILRTPTDQAGYRESELSLIAFPYQDLFDRDLWSFDVVIFQNFDYEPYFGRQSPQLLGNVRSYVEQGGAFVMIGGDRSFSLGEYEGTPIAELLPFEISNGQGAEEAPFHAALSPEGARHPITRIVADGSENAEYWSRLSSVDGSNVVTGAKPGAAVLLTHPTRKLGNGQPLPVLAVREAGQGRVMALTADSSWRWSFGEAGEGRGNQAYLRFWKNSLRWLMRDASVERVVAETSRENYLLGDEIRIVARVKDTGFAPLAGADVKVSVSVGGREQVLDGVTSESGDLILTIPADQRGAHRVRVEASVGGQPVGAAETVFAVSARDPELDEVSPDEAYLRWLAERTEGRYVGPSDDAVVLVDDSAGRIVQERRETVLWRSPWLLGLAALCAGLAWIVRRRAGLM